MTVSIVIPGAGVFRGGSEGLGVKKPPPTEYFYELTPERIHYACQQAGLNMRPGVTFLNSLENRVVRLEDEEGERWVAKF